MCFFQTCFGVSTARLVNINHSTMNMASICRCLEVKPRDPETTTPQKTHHDQNAYKRNGNAKQPKWLRPRNTPPPKKLKRRIETATKHQQPNPQPNQKETRPPRKGRCKEMAQWIFEDFAIFGMRLGMHFTGCWNGYKLTMDGQIKVLGPSGIRVSKKYVWTVV